MLKEIFNRKTLNREEIVATMNHYNHLKDIAEVEKIKLQKVIQKQKNELDNIYSSRSWKITEPLRKIKKFSNK